MDFMIAQLPRIFLLLIALVFLIFGAIGLFNPTGTVSPMDIAIQTAQAKTEIRATYGGFMIGIGLMLVYTAYDINAIRFGLIAVMCMLFVVGFTRLYGIVADGTQAALQWQLLCLELGPAVIALLLLVFRKE